MMKAIGVNSKQQLWYLSINQSSQLMQPLSATMPVFLGAWTPQRKTTMGVCAPHRPQLRQNLPALLNQALGHQRLRLMMAVVKSGSMDVLTRRLLTTTNVWTLTHKHGCSAHAHVCAPWMPASAHRTVISPGATKCTTAPYLGPLQACALRRNSVV